MFDPRIAPMAFCIFLLTLGLSLWGFKKPALLNRLMLHPFSLKRMKGLYTPLTSGFVHADGSHLFMNMLTFYFFAFGLESMIGSWNFFIVYFGSLLFSDISTIIKQRNNANYRCLGASGAISGILFSYILILPSTKIYLLLLPIGIPAPLFAALYIVYSFYSSRKRYDNINHDAHLWGALSGLILTFLLFPGLLERIILKISSYF